MEAPHYAEELAASDFQRITSSPSRFASGVMIAKTVNICPNCRKAIKGLSHGTYRECGCGLRMKLFGNALYIWRAADRRWDDA